MKKVFAMLMILALIVGVFGGCASKAQTASSEEQTQDFSNAVFPQVEKPEFSTIDIVEKLPEKPIRIAFLGCQSNPWWNNVREGARMAGEYLKNFNCEVDYIIVGKDIEVSTVNAALEAATAQGYDGITFVSFADGTSSYVERAVDQGIPVVTLYGEDSHMTDKRLAFLGSDSYAFGYRAGELLSEAMGEDGGEYVIIHATFSSMSASVRVDGARAGLATNPNNVCVGEYEGKDSAELTYDLVTSAIDANPNLKGVYCAAGGAYGASKAVEDAGKAGQITVFAHDMTQENLEYAAKGLMIINDYNCMQYAIDACILLYNKIVADQDPEQKIITGGIDGSMYADKDNAAYWQELLFSET